ncbi:hypothetical protein PMAYCL1PPCAC_29423, partial [Pristionchus mayeri]
RECRPLSSSDFSLPSRFPLYITFPFRFPFQLTTLNSSPEHRRVEGRGSGRELPPSPLQTENTLALWVPKSSLPASNEDQSDCEDMKPCKVACYRMCDRFRVRRE